MGSILVIGGNSDIGYAIAKIDNISNV